MTILDADGRAPSLWSRWRRQSEWSKIAVALVVVGVVVPPISAGTLRSVRPPLVEAIGVALAVAGLGLLVVRTRREAARLVADVTEDLRNLADLVAVCTSKIDDMTGDVAALKTTLDGERRNLGMVAGGLGEMRQIVQLERVNLGLMANGVDETRTALRAFHDALQDARRELDGIADHASALSTRQDDLQSELRVERRNLGMVAGALDDVRRQAAGVDLFDARQAAFEDTLIELADRIDRIDADDHPGDVGEADVDE